jgi:ABC-type uncharacterized transport system permease subunit
VNATRGGSKLASCEVNDLVRNSVYLIPLNLIPNVLDPYAAWLTLSSHAFIPVQLLQKKSLLSFYQQNSTSARSLALQMKSQPGVDRDPKAYSLFGQ